jgi:hypothetical protein
MTSGLHLRVLLPHKNESSCLAIRLAVIVAEPLGIAGYDGSFSPSTNNPQGTVRSIVSDLTEFRDEYQRWIDSRPINYLDLSDANANRLAEVEAFLEQGWRGSRRFGYHRGAAYPARLRP